MARYYKNDIRRIDRSALENSVAVDGEVIKVGTLASPISKATAGYDIALFTTLSAITGSNRSIIADVLMTGQITTLGNYTIRGQARLSAAVDILGGAYIAGIQAKFTMASGAVINHADCRVCAMLVQLDVSGGTYTAGQLSALWVDCGASGNPGVGDGQGNIIRISNTTTWVPHAVFFVYAEATYMFNFAGGPGGNADWYSTTSAGGATRKHKIACLGPDGAACYMSLYTD